MFIMLDHFILELGFFRAADTVFSNTQGSLSSSKWEKERTSVSLTGQQGLQ